MNWQLFLYTFVFNKMCEIIYSGARTHKGFKEVHLNSVAKQVFEFCGQEVTSPQVYNHPRKWRTRWIISFKLRDVSGSSWDEDTCTIMLEAEHYQRHIADHPKDAEFLNTSIENYHHMQQIFSFGLAVGNHAMGCDRPMPLMRDYPHTRESGTINIDAPEKEGQRVHVLDRKRQRACFMKEELIVFNNMTEAMKEVAISMRESKTVDVHPKLYDAIMKQISSSREAFMVSLSHLLDNKAQGVGFVAMGEAHMVLWVRTWMGKHYYWCCFCWWQRRA
ncbi:hypothetical protein ZWY2020_049789 [Hordeum vulgare]|nr:hypothetical protein ZWY2020_049789 [Hordeum vulgare]